MGGLECVDCKTNGGLHELFGEWAITKNVLTAQKCQVSLQPRPFAFAQLSHKDLWDLLQSSAAQQLS